MDMPLLSTVKSPADVRIMTKQQKLRLCDELRSVIIDTVSRTGGHLASNLGVVELTVALHTVFETPRDTIVWDVGHQCYVHKLLTGRFDRFDTIRQNGGLSGFPQPRESVHDAFIVGHSSTSVSAANGIAKAKALTGSDGYTVAVLGDGALTGGLAYEGLSNVGRSKDRVIVILNDNRMSISSNVGFAARHLSHLRMKPRYVRVKNRISHALSRIPWLGKRLVRVVGRTKSFFKHVIYDDSSLFADMGFYYLGPVDGHDLDELDLALATARNIDQPVLIHVETVKGKGASFAENSPDRYHGVGKFDPDTGDVGVGGSSFSSVFGEVLEAIMDEDAQVCAITAAMQSGTGLERLAEKYPKRCFDVGIAEGHAVTFASGLATKGMIPVFAVYSSFLQRAYDQLLNDTSVMNNHIVLGIDRAGVVPADGETHQGLFDVPFLTTVPHTTIYAPATYEELSVCLKQAVYDVDGIAAVRYPKGSSAKMPEDYVPDYRPLRCFGSGGEVLLVTYGRLTATVLEAADRLGGKGCSVNVLKLTRVWPFDDVCLPIVQQYRTVHFFEEGFRSGGIGEKLGAALLQTGFCGRYAVHAVDEWIPACTTEEGLSRVGLDVDGICRAVEG